MYSVQGVSGVEVTGVIKVENRFQYTRFNDKLKLELEKEVFSSLSSWKSLLDYLFIVWQPGSACALPLHHSPSPV